MISPDVIDQIRQRVSLAQIVGQTLKLEKRGRSFVGLCPFHKEKTPSFHVHDERGFFHCFGCHAKGDVFKFIQEIEGLSFVEAVRRLGELAGVEVTDDLTSDERKQRAARKRREEDFYRINALAAAFFEKKLGDPREAALALTELEKRGLPWSGPQQETLRAFRVGYAPHSWDALTTYLQAQGVDLRQAETLGLIMARRQGSGYYDRFRHRLMFAVLDIQGRVIAFSGRSLPPPPHAPEEAESPAKYINSPESPIYKKREAVFGLFQAKNTLRNGEAAVLVEGNFDVLSLHARGFPQAVAPLGTAFTVEQGKQIRRFASELIFLFDSDTAGKKAVRASRSVCRDSQLLARVATLPAGMDPDDFSRTRGSEALSHLLRASRGMLDYLIAEILDENFTAASTHARAQKIEEVLELIRSEEDATVRALAEQHADQLAARLGIDDARTFRALQNSIRASLGPQSAAPLSSQNPSLPQQAPHRAQSRKRAHEIQTEILGALLDYPSLLDNSEFLAYANHMQGDLAAAVALLRKTYEKSLEVAPSSAPDARDFHGPFLDEALLKMPDSLRDFAQERSVAPLHTDLPRALRALVLNLEKMQQLELSRQTASTLGEIERARSEGDFDQELLLLREQEMRARKRRGL